MAIRYSGELTLRVTLRDDDQYTVHIACDGRNLDIQIVRLSPEMSRRVALDSPEAFDAAAHAALSFAENEASIDPTLAAPSGRWDHCWTVSRSKAEAWGSAPPGTSRAA